MSESPETTIRKYLDRKFKPGIGGEAGACVARDALDALVAERDAAVARAETKVGLLTIGFTDARAILAERAALVARAERAEKVVEAAQRLDEAHLNTCQVYNANPPWACTCGIDALWAAQAADLLSDRCRVVLASALAGLGEET